MRLYLSLIRSTHVGSHFMCSLATRRTDKLPYIEDSQRSPCLDAYFQGFEAFEANLSISVLILESKSITNLLIAKNFV